MNSDIPQAPPAVPPGLPAHTVPAIAAHADQMAADLEADRIAEEAQAAADDLLEQGYADDYDAAAAAAEASQAPPGWEYEGRPVALPPRRQAPVLIHSGHYALYQTPAGQYHLTYQREASTHPDTGEITAVEGAPEVHFRDLPEHAATMVLAVMDRDQQLPPMLEAFLFGGANPLAGGKAAMMRQMAAMVGEAGGLDQLLEFAQRYGGGEDAGPVG